MRRSVATSLASSTSFPARGAWFAAVRSSTPPARCRDPGRRARLGRAGQGGSLGMAGDLGEFDYVVVGAGTAGCVLANRLSADPGNRVLLLEAGGSDRYVWIHVPVGYLYTQNNPRTDWCFRTDPQPGLGGRALNYPRGKVLGGCSAINGMIYMRGQSADYDHWRQLGNPGWAWDDVLPYFKRSEDHWQGADQHHGAGGEWRGGPPRPARGGGGPPPAGAGPRGRPAGGGPNTRGHEGGGALPGHP